MKKLTVLITAAGGNSTPSYIDCLKNNFEKRQVKIVCSDINNQPVIRFKADSFHILPKANSKKYIDSLVKLCKNNKVDVILPCSWSEVFSISKNIEIFKENNISVAVSNFEVIKKLMDKFSVYQLLNKYKIPVPKSFLVTNKKDFKNALMNLGYPKKTICFKPSKYSSSGGNRGFRILKVNNSLKDIILNQKPGSADIDYETAMRIFQEKNIELMVSEYLSGDEFSVHILAKKGKMLHCIPFHKKRSIHGHSLESSIVKNKECVSICKKIVKILNADYNLNIQLKKSNSGKLKLIEINPRIGGGVSLPMAAGINLPYLGVKLALNEKLPVKKKYDNTTMFRYWKELFLKNSKTFELS